MKNLIFLSVLFIPFLFSCPGCLQPGEQGIVPDEVLNASRPKNATYLIKNEWVRLADGHSKTEIIPGAATKTITTVCSQPAFGDLDGNGDADAALLLVQQGGGSGSFYYVAAALNADGSYRGTNAVFLGDRIAPLSITIRAGQIVVLYNDRRSDEPMVTMPTVIKAKHFRLEGVLLEEVSLPASDGNQLEQGWVTLGHEVRSFQSCRDMEPRWLLGDSAALPEIKTAHSHALFVTPPCFPLFMALSGASVPPPEAGFGRDYETAFRADRLAEADPRGYCRNELIEVDRPVPGERITSQLTVTGQARGTWYFEGDFPLILTDARGRIIAQGFATAQGPWMTQNWVPFSGTLQLQRRHTPDWGWLVLKKDNPSDRSELDAEVSIPVLLE